MQKKHIKNSHIVDHCKGGDEVDRMRAGQYEGKIVPIALPSGITNERLMSRIDKAIVKLSKKKRTRKTYEKSI